MIPSTESHEAKQLCCLLWDRDHDLLAHLGVASTVNNANEENPRMMSNCLCLIAFNQCLAKQRWVCQTVLLLCYNRVSYFNCYLKQIVFRKFF